MTLTTQDLIDQLRGTLEFYVLYDEGESTEEGLKKALEILESVEYEFDAINGAQ